MDQPKTSARSSKGEVAFRFIACTGIAMALYYTPDIRWHADAPDLRADRLDAALSSQFQPASSACGPRERADLLVDASLEGR